MKQAPLILPAVFLSLLLCGCGGLGSSSESASAPTAYSASISKSCPNKGSWTVQSQSSSTQPAQQIRQGEAVRITGYITNGGPCLGGSGSGFSFTCEGIANIGGDRGYVCNSGTISLYNPAALQTSSWSFNNSYNYNAQSTAAHSSSFPIVQGSYVAVFNNGRDHAVNIRFQNPMFHGAGVCSAGWGACLSQ